jgi:H/ACA ribonucleoprotein complex subunit 1
MVDHNSHKTLVKYSNMRGARGGGRGGGRGGNSRGGSRGGGRGGFSSGGNFKDEVPDSIEPVGTYVQNSQELLVFKSIHQNIPLCDSPAFLEDKSLLGKITEVLGPINSVLFAVEVDKDAKKKTWKVGEKCFINPRRTLPLERFLPQEVKNPLEPKIKKAKAEGSGRGGRGGRGNGRGRGGFSSPGRGGGRGSFSSPGRGGGRGGFSSPGRGGGRGGGSRGGSGGRGGGRGGF